MAAIFPQSELDRVAETAKIRAIWESRWSDLLREHIVRQRGRLVAALIGEPDISSNFVRNFGLQTVSLYDFPPAAVGDPTLLDLLKPYWTQATANAHYVRVLRDSIVLVGWDYVANRATYELITGDRCFIEPDKASGNPASMGALWIARERPSPHSGRVAWFWDRWGADGLTIWTGDRKYELTHAFYPDSRPARYTKADGSPRIPAVLYHGQGAKGGTWNNIAAELSFAALQIGMIWTGTVHGHLKASYDIKVLLNGRIQGGAVESVGGQAVRHLVADPTGVVQVAGERAAIASWGASANTMEAEKFSRSYEYRIWCLNGLPSSDFAQEMINPSSGAAIVVSQAGKRNIALKDIPHFRQGDQELAKVVCDVARAHGVSASPAGFSLRYRGARLAPQELTQIVPAVVQAVRAGVMSRAEAYAALHPELEPDEAEAEAMELERIEVSRSLGRMVPAV
jgi:hypothetical protein